MMTSKNIVCLKDEGELNKNIATYLSVRVEIIKSASSISV
jgi:hypothetical protein